MAAFVVYIDNSCKVDNNVMFMKMYFQVHYDLMRVCNFFFLYVFSGTLFHCINRQQ
jgi:hypothetical protein